MDQGKDIGEHLKQQPGGIAGTQQGTGADAQRVQPRQTGTLAKERSPTGDRVAEKQDSLQADQQPPGSGT